MYLANRLGPSLTLSEPQNLPASALNVPISWISNISVLGSAHQPVLRAD